MMAKNVLKKLVIIQSKLKAPKNQFNSFGKYKYRSCEDILENARPLANENSCVIVLNDDIKEISGRYYVEATATLFDADSGEEISAKALAREADTKKGMDESQITGASSSYARKYALSALFALDDTKDADTMDNREPASTKNSAPKPVQKQSQTDEKHKLLSNIVAKTKKHNISNSSIGEIIKAKYNKSSSRELTVEEVKDLDVNFYTYIKDLFNTPKKPYREDKDMKELERMSAEQQEKTDKLAKIINECKNENETFATYGDCGDGNTGDIL